MTFARGLRRRSAVSVAETAAEGSLAEDLASAARFGGDGDGGDAIRVVARADAAHRWLAQRLGRSGLTGELDAAGNVVGRWAAGAGRAVSSARTSTRCRAGDAMTVRSACSPASMRSDG